MSKLLAGSGRAGQSCDASSLVPIVYTKNQRKHSLPQERKKKKKKKKKEKEKKREKIKKILLFSDCLVNARLGTQLKLISLLCLSRSYLSPAGVRGFHVYVIVLRSHSSKCYLHDVVHTVSGYGVCAGYLSGIRQLAPLTQVRH